MREGFEDRMIREAAEANVALSHPADHDCDVCVRVRKRFAERQQEAQFRRRYIGKP